MRINKKKLGMINTKRCKRCKEFFFPSAGNQVLCPYCQNRPYHGKGRPPKHMKCEIFWCNRLHSGKGYCDVHYKQLIGTPRGTRSRRLRAAQKWLEEGAVMCEMFRDCEVYFIPKARNQYGIQKICPTCALKRDSRPKREKTGRPRKKER